MDSPVLIRYRFYSNLEQWALHMNALNKVCHGSSDWREVLNISGKESPMSGCEFIRCDSDSPPPPNFNYFK